MADANRDDPRRKGQTVLASFDGGAAPAASRREARTLLGRDRHYCAAPPARDERRRSGLRLTPAPAGPALPTVAPAPAPPRLAEAPSHTGKSGFPTIARIWGRRDSSGALVPFELEDEDLPAGGQRPRRVLLVGAAALLGLVALALALRGPRTSPAPATSPVPATSPAPAEAPAPPAPVAPPTRPTTAPATRVAPEQVPPARAPAQVPTAPARPPRAAPSPSLVAPRESAPPPRRAVRRGGKSTARPPGRLDPDGTLPPGF